MVEAVRGRFGASVLDAQGLVDRAALGPRAFAEKGGLAFLEQLVFARVGRMRRAWIAECCARTPPPPLLVCEVPILFEAGVEGEFDAVIVVTASDAVRRGRVEARGQDFDQRRARQIAEEEKVTRADRAYVNDGDIAGLHAWIADRYAEYAGRPCSTSHDE